ncbi:hypothetical protein OG21DRAFT_1511880 [Imleria badia]|nr:hypothetical protein OG21DRAFT_1511880 [Imleria badia]
MDTGTSVEFRAVQEGVYVYVPICLVLSYSIAIIQAKIRQDQMLRPGLRLGSIQGILQVKSSINQDLEIPAPITLQNAATKVQSDLAGKPLYSFVVEDPDARSDAQYSFCASIG